MPVYLRFQARSGSPTSARKPLSNPILRAPPAMGAVAQRGRRFPANAPHCAPQAAPNARPSSMNQLFAASSVSLLAQQNPAANLGSMLLPIVMIFVLFYFLLLRPERQKQAQQRAMLEALKKDDHVVTFGGIYGVVTNVQRDADKVTLKIDENTGARLQVTLSSIARVVRGEPAEPTAPS
jgi:preprotein translocase subunit YajC